jgi:hypothetical protein
MILKSALRKRIEIKRNDLLRELERMKTDPELTRGRKKHHITIQIRLLTEILEK